MNYDKPKVKWTEIIEKIENSGYRKDYIVSKINVPRQYLYKMLNGLNYMSDAVKERLESFFDCKFERPTPEPEKEPT